ncbi:MAG TPA: hypothetical protein VKP60_01765 [Magnetospirillaceae bacterium]|nr:hypothetical protein [Magnetospirillaceae bacterium]
MNRRNMLLFGGLAISAAIAVFGDHTPNSSTVVEAAPHTAPAARTADHKHAAPAILALAPRQDLIGHAPPSEPPALFGTRALFDKPAESAADSAPVLPATPPLPFTYLGKKFENGRWEIFLALGERTYFVREGSVIDGTYVVNAIKPPSMILTFLPQKEMQTLTIGADQ